MGASGRKYELLAFTWTDVGGKIFFSGENLEEYVKYERLPVREVSDRVWHVRKRKFDHYGLRDVGLSMGFPYPERISEIAKADGFSVQSERFLYVIPIRRGFLHPLT